MKYLCPACDRLAEIASFQVEGGALLVTCARCGAQTREERRAAPPAASAPALVRSMPAPTAAPPPPARRVEPAVPSAEAPPAEAPAPDSAGQVVFLRARAPTGAFPASREDPLAVPDGYCPKCISLRRGNGPTCASCGLVFSVFDPQEHLPPPPLLEAWKRLAQSWEDNAGHDRFVQLAVTQGGLAAAGRLYRIQLAHNPDDPYAARGRDEVLRVAAAASALDLGAAERKPALLSRRNQKWVVAGLVLALALVVGILIQALTSLGAG